MEIWCIGDNTQLGPERLLARIYCKFSIPKIFQSSSRSILDRQPCSGKRDPARIKFKHCLICYSNKQHSRAKKMEDIERKLQDTVNTIAQSDENQGFRISVNKTYCVHFCRLRKVHQEPKITLNGADIKIKYSGRFLELIFDRKLLRKDHITDLAMKCKMRLNILRTVSNINWGSDTNALIKLYKSKVLSKIDYGSTVYASASKSTLKKLDQVQANGLRLALERLELALMQRFVLKRVLPHWNTGEITCYQITIVKSTHYLLTQYMTSYLKRRMNIRITTKEDLTRINHLTSELEEPTPNVYTFQPESPAPWLLEPPKIYLNCLKYDKNSTPRLMIDNEIHLILENHNNPTLIHTDGSKTRQGVGSAIVVGDQTLSWKLHAWSSIYTAEMHAISEALKYIENRNIERAAICSDSLAPYTNSKMYTPMTHSPILCEPRYKE
ncbi:hypothetical protein JTB14_021163 [Gonioctena quinquepunctata]|nr:hypothetical protein JTB14_021163 [Gonioctena quinquepunctata]